MSDQRGTALLSAVTILALLLPLVAHTVVQGHIDLLIARNFRDQTDALYSAEAGIEHVLATLGEVGTLSRLLSGPDQIANTADDRTLMLPSLPGLAAAYSLRVDRLNANTIEVTSSASGKNGATRALVVMIQSSATPFTPAAVFVDGNTRPLTLNAPELEISGHDASAPGAGAQNLAFANTLRARFDVVSLVQKLATHPSALHFASGVASPTLGTATAPQLSVVDGDLELAGTANGAGILLVLGSLRITGVLRFDGLICTTGALASSPSSQLFASGAIWQASAIDSISLAGRGFIHYSSAALDHADTAAPDLLPHALRVLGRHEAT